MSDRHRSENDDFVRKKGEVIVDVTRIEDE